MLGGGWLLEHGIAPFLMLGGGWLLEHGIAPFLAAFLATAVAFCHSTVIK
jgi:hypothetical protein